MSCVFCHGRVLHYETSEFCDACELAWQEAQLSPDGSLTCSTGPELPYRIYSHYFYRDICRDSILGCKVAGNRPLGRALARRAVR
jgi:predicted amidophosphoribosyltransferase